MRLPDFLIIGAMKSGTTGVFLDLCRHPRIFIPQNKEPNALGSDAVLSDSGRSDYAAEYAGARDDQLLCDATTAYSKRPDREGVAERAIAVLPSPFRVVYIVRDPIDRIISQHYHEFIDGTIHSDIDRAVREEDRFINYSRYGYQLAPWIERLGNDRVQVVRFESYKSDRQATIAQLCSFLGLPVEQLPTIESAVHNRSEEKTVMNSFWHQAQQSVWYQRGVRPLLSPRWRIQLQKWVLPRGPERPAPPSLETVHWLKEQLTPEVRQISDFAGCQELLWKGYGPEEEVGAPK